MKKVNKLGLAVCLCCGLSCSTQSSLPEKGTDAARNAKTETLAAGDFTIVVMPDTQNYMSGYFGATYAMFTAQIDWIKANKTNMNIAYVAGVGDIVEHGDDQAYASEWTEAATNGYYRLEPDGIAYGLAVGNHDQTPVNNSILTATTTKYNQYFGGNHFASKPYYGGNLAGSGSNNNNSHYDLFSAGGVDFIVIYLEYDHLNEQSTLLNDWAYNLCTTYASRKAIVVTHYAAQAPTGAWGTQGYRIWNKLKGCNNVFMILGGHVTGDAALPDLQKGEAYREDTYNGHTIRTYVSDYQGRATTGGAGRLRIMKFSVTNDDVTVKTFSPWNSTGFETDVSSQFTKPLFGPAPTAQVPDGKYKVVARHSGKVLTVYNASTASGADIVQWDYTSGAGNLPNDEWNLTQIGTSGYYKFINAHSGLGMNVQGVSTAVGGLVKQYNYGADSIYNDEFALIPVGGGYYKIIARHSGLCMNVAGASQSNGALIKQWDYVGDLHTHFQLVPVP
jgi:hypothetical protein